MDNLIWIFPILSAIFFGLAFYGQSVKVDRLEKDLEKLKELRYNPSKRIDGQHSAPSF